MLFPTQRLPAKHQKLRHPHPLFVCERKIVEPRILADFSCGGCFQSFDDKEEEVDYSTLIYVCLECHVLLHQSCADLPQQITHHPFHLDCTLTFHISSAYDDYHFHYPSCDFCQNSSRLYFQCSDCSLKMDLNCALLTACTTTNYEPVGKEKDNGHLHPLIHCNIHVNHYVICGACDKLMEESTYYCASCKMFLHKSCAELPHVIQHPFHPLHPLTLSYPLDPLPGKICHVCHWNEISTEFYYQCDLCQFYLHSHCASPILYPMIYMSELHQHPLVYSDNIPSSPGCSKCTNHISAGFRCVQCKFDIHDYCLPLLPPMVNTKWHRHPLTLTYDPIKDDPDEDENAVFYCDCCQEQRDLKHPTYYCAECHLISHVRCVMWEVMNYLQEKSTKVEELCNTKVIVIGETKAIDSIYAAAENKDGMEQGDHQDIFDEDSDHILSIRLCNEIAAISAELVEHKAKSLEDYKKICATTYLKFKKIEERLSQRIAYTKLNSNDTTGA